MTNEQWERLVATIHGDSPSELPVGFIIDSPWLPGWAGATVLDYYSSGRTWFDANMQAIRTFPDVMFLPGFWSEYGMCTEPSAFGCKCRWAEHELPYADKVLTDASHVRALKKPNPKTDGLLPLALRRLLEYQGRINEAGHEIKFAVARGPLNVAGFLMGSTEFLMAVRTDPDEVHQLLGLVTDFLVDWLRLQAETLPSIDGVFILDDVVGFLGKDDFQEVVLPYLKRAFEALDATVRFFHNDAAGLVCAPFLPEVGVNLFNFGFEHSIAQMQELTKGQVTLLGNVPPRDVLANGSPEDVRQSVAACLEGVIDKRRIVLSCGGGMPPDVTTDNIRAFVEASRDL